MIALLALAFAEPVTIGPVVARSGPVALPPGLSLAPCVAQPSSLPAAATAVGGRLTLVVRFRRNRVSLVTTAAADPGVAPLGACFERELASAEWGVRRGRVEVPITVSPPPVEEP